MGFGKHRRLDNRGNNRAVQLLRPGAKPKKLHRLRRVGQAPSNGSRPSKLDDRLEAEICEYLRAGASLADASVMVGLGTDTAGVWRRKGEEEPESRFGLFLDRTEEAMTEWKTRMNEEGDRVAGLESGLENFVCPVSLTNTATS